jgi:hypothetical protein
MTMTMTTNEAPYMQRAVEELHKIFQLVNKHFFAGEELETPVITVQGQGRKRGILGWCTVYPIWKDNNKEIQQWEINITAEYLNRPWIDITETMLHEMVHLYNTRAGVKDTSRGNVYHNKHFKKEAENRGLLVERDPKLGWAITRLSPEAQEIIEKWDIDPEAFKLARLPESAPGKKGGKGSNSIKMVCPMCGGIARITKEFRLKCGECDVFMEESD